MNQEIQGAIANLTVFKCKGRPSGDINDQSNRPDEYEMEYCRNLLGNENAELMLDPNSATFIRARAVSGVHVFELELSILVPGLNNQQIRPFVNQMLVRLTDNLRKHALPEVSNSKQKEWYRVLTTPDIQIGATVIRQANA